MKDYCCIITAAIVSFSRVVNRSWLASTTANECNTFSQCMNKGLFKSWVEALVLWLWEETRMQEVVGSNLNV